MNSEAPSGTPPADEQPKGTTQETNATSKPFVPKSASEALRPEPGTPPPRKRSRHARSQIVVFMNFMLSLVVLVLLGASALFYFGKMQFDGQGPLTAETTFLVKRGAGIAEVSNSLENREIVSDARIFRYGMRTLGHENDLKAGEYAIPAGASMRDVMNILISGKSIMYPLTIPEGLTVKQIFDRISADPTLVGDMPKDMPPEGSLFTDTLNFTRGTTRSEIIDRMVASQKKLVDEAWAKRNSDLPVKDKNEFVTLASIVEKETGIASERPHVASVFVNRLKKGMRIQSDPTIIYGLFGGAGKPSDRPIFKSDIEKPTPYNTYVINGLPPTPIANPGRAALEAVANPLDTEDLYFVADGTGGHVFSKTLQEHNANVRKWRSVEQQKNIEQQNNSGSNTDQSSGQSAGQ
ncbi:endolytic transglycosylase MltG [Ochrobactrum sp. POC9]|uniref:endolytic transglycosylase MltG n=1 Tax=Ochrobactrum sp. POC9 TaxID=2203419 RepID=UPI000D7066D8|nr:endolytic transglycosylase MltG [Ochrobactrum sp. POC9]PWU77185.1 endolytic transglycosylase MltG [Ochrobactrum sp. POC9]